MSLSSFSEDTAGATSPSLIISRTVGITAPSQASAGNRLIPSNFSCRTSQVPPAMPSHSDSGPVSWLIAPVFIFLGTKMPPPRSSSLSRACLNAVLVSAVTPTVMLLASSIRVARSSTLPGPRAKGMMRVFGLPCAAYLVRASVVAVAHSLPMNTGPPSCPLRPWTQAVEVSVPFEIRISV